MSEIDFYKRLNRLEKRRKGTDLTYNAFDSERFVTGVYKPEIMADGFVLFPDGSPIEFGF